MHAIVLLVVGTLAACAAPEPPRGAPPVPSHGGPRSTTTTAPSSTTTVTPSTTTSTTSTPPTTSAPSTTTSSTIPPSPDGTIELVTHVPGPKGYFGTSSSPAISPDGQYVTFSSTAKLTEDDTNPVSDIYLWDAGTSTTVRITDVGEPVDQVELFYDTGQPAISADGRQVAFSSSWKFVAGDTNGAKDVFVWDAASGTTARITDGLGGSDSPSISADGRRVAFVSRAPLVPDDTNGRRDVFLWDGDTGVTTRVTDNLTGYYRPPVLSGDGRYVAYVVSDVHEQIFVWDSATGATVEIAAGDGSHEDPTMSADGRFVAFASTSTDLIPGETTEPGVFLWDATTDSIVRIGAGRGPAISPDGGHIAFSADTSKPVTDPDSIGYIADVFLWNAASNSITQVTDGDQSSYAASISVGGNTIAFSSSASNLVDEPANGNSDVFVWTRSE